MEKWENCVEPKHLFVNFLGPLEDFWTLKTSYLDPSDLHVEAKYLFVNFLGPFKGFQRLLDR